MSYDDDEEQQIDKTGSFAADEPRPRFELLSIAHELTDSDICNVTIQNEVIAILGRNNRPPCPRHGR